MFRKKRLFILIPTLLLIPLLAGMVPVKLATRWHGGEPVSRTKVSRGAVVTRIVPPIHSSPRTTLTA